MKHLPRNLAESAQFPDKPHLALIDTFTVTDQGFRETVCPAGPGGPPLWLLGIVL